jgi:hypothetical protein
MADLEEILSQLQPEDDASEGFDWVNAPEMTGGGKYPPDVYPGTYEFLFRLPEDADKQFAAPVVQGKARLEVNYNCDLLRNEDGSPVPPREDGSQRKAMFQRANNGLYGKMKMSFMQDLIRCLGLAEQAAAQSPGGKLDPRVAGTILKQADGRATGKAVFGWRLYFKSPDGDKTKGVTFSTHPRKKERQWPKRDGKFIEAIPSPFDPTDLQMGRLELVQYKLPAKAGAAGGV